MTAVARREPAGITPFLDDAVQPAVRGWLHAPPAGTGDALALTHGAGANCNAPLLVAVAEAFSDAGLTVLRFDLPFRQARPQGPPRPGDAARDREGIAAVMSALRKRATGRLFLGGHSYGGRQTTMFCAELPDATPTASATAPDALLLLSYPLHPPRRPQQLRTAHFPRLRTPALFVHGARDPFASFEELEAALPLIPGSTRLLRVERAGHDLRTSRRDPSAGAELPAAIVREFMAFANIRTNS